MSNQSLARRAATVIIAVYEQAEHELKDLRAKSDESLWLADTLLQIEAHLGHHEEMAHEAEDLIEQTKRDQWRFPVTETVLARAYVIADESTTRCLCSTTRCLCLPKRQLRSRTCAWIPYRTGCAMILVFRNSRTISADES
ncbi:MAG: hypothetical protein M3Y69_05645 [Verrucomicrobiota bacterium]|nr:hypothetical protein [Verrucomicrobiota bacterium]